MAKDNCFPNSSVLGNPFHSTQNLSREKTILFCTPKKIYLFRQVTVQSETDQGTL